MSNLLNLYNLLIGWWRSPDVVFWISVLKIISAIISVAFFAGIIILVQKLKIIQDKWALLYETIKKRPKIPKKEELIKQWEKILERLASQKEADYKLAVIEADKLLDDLLVKMNFKGKDMGERLEKITKDELLIIDRVWRAHRIRNAIVHKPDFKINYSEAKEIIEIYEKALKEFGLI